MSRFESPAQILVLFLVASVVSIGIIYFIKAEQHSRLRHLRGAVEEMVVTSTESQEEATSSLLMTRLQTGFVRVLNFFRNTTIPIDKVSRVKRSNSAGESSNFHRIRHALKKLDGGGLEGDVVYRMILDSIPIQAPQPEKKKVLDYQAWDFDLPHDLRQSSRVLPTESNHLVKSFESIVDDEVEENTVVLGDTKSSAASLEQTAQPLTVSSSPQLLRNGLENSIVSTTNQVKLSALPVDVCYGTDDVLVVIGITCSLNFAFVLLIWACVRWFSVTKEKDFQNICGDGDEGGGCHGDVEDDFWVSTSGIPVVIEENVRNGTFNPDQTTTSTTSLYTIRREGLPDMKKSHSYSMEDLRYPVHTS